MPGAACVLAGVRCVPAGVVCAAWLLIGCAAPHVRNPIEEEPFVLSPGPSPSEREALRRREQAAGLPSGGSATGSRGRTPIERVGPTGRIPLVHVTVAGRAARFLLDTGAYDHILEGWFAHELQDAEASGKSAAVMDHANRKVAMDAYSEVSFALDGWGPLGNIRPLATRDPTMGPVTLGIGGILSPQKLARGVAVVLDFPAGEMRTADLAGATALAGAHHTSLGTAIRCGTHYLVAATVEGKEARLLVDTGASGTDLKGSSPAGRALAGRSGIARDLNTVGGAVGARVIPDAKLVVGQLVARLDVQLVDDRAFASRCGSDGVVGMDVLASCVVVIEPNAMRIGCD
jgi:predicted aspartyl protease